MQITIVLLSLTVFAIFIYTWREFRINIKPQKTIKKPVLNIKLKVVKKILKTSDNVKISSWYIPAENPKAVVILVHGYKEINAGKSRMLVHAQYLKKAGYSTFLIDLRSFGESEGDKMSFGINESKDVIAAYDYLKSLPENKNKKIGFFGRSMGAATSIIASAISGKGDFIIALTPYASLKRLFNFRLIKKGYFTPIFFPFLQIAAFIELGLNFEKYAPINLIGKINVPIFIVGAKYDESIPKKDAKRLFNKANNPKEFWEAPTNHDEIFRQNPKRFKKKILAFLSKYT